MKNTVQILLENREDGLGRLIGVFRRRGYQIENLSMTVDHEELTRIIVGLSCSPLALQQLVQYIGKLVDVVAVEVVDDHTGPAETYMPVHQSA